MGINAASREAFDVLRDRLVALGVSDGTASVKGQQDPRGGGHENCAVMGTSSAR